MNNKNRVLYPGFLVGLILIAVSGDILAQKQEDDTWKVRSRVIYVDPNDDSGSISSIPDSGVGVDSVATFEMDFTYMINPHFGLELILATTRHMLSGKGSISGFGVIGETGVLPPTLTAQYHIIPGGKFRPYIGAGLNYTLFYSEEITDSAVPLGGTSISLDNSFGLAAQAGIDIDITNGWYFNIDVKYIQMETTATLSGTLDGTVDVDINPLVIGVGFGTYF